MMFFLLIFKRYSAFFMSLMLSTSIYASITGGVDLQMKPDPFSPMILAIALQAAITEGSSMAIGTW